MMPDLLPVMYEKCVGLLLLPKHKTLTVGRVNLLLGGSQSDSAGPQVPTALRLVLGGTEDPCAVGPAGDVGMGCSWQPRLGCELQASAPPAAAACSIVLSGGVIS